MLSKSLELITQAERSSGGGRGISLRSARTTATEFVLTELKLGLQLIAMARQSYQQNTLQGIDKRRRR